MLHKACSRPRLSACLGNSPQQTRYPVHAICAALCAPPGFDAMAHGPACSQKLRKRLRCRKNEKQACMKNLVSRNRRFLRPSMPRLLTKPSRLGPVHLSVERGVGCRNGWKNPQGRSHTNVVSAALSADPLARRCPGPNKRYHQPQMRYDGQSTLWTRVPLEAA